MGCNSSRNFHRKEAFVTESLSQEYLLLFNTIIDTENALDALRKKLINALDEAEDLYINKED